MCFGTNMIFTKSLFQYNLITCLVINEKLNWVVAPFNQHNLICLPWYTVRKRRAYARAGAGLDPHAESESIHLWQALGDTAIQVVGTLGQGQLKLLWGYEVTSACNKIGRKDPWCKEGAMTHEAKSSHLYFTFGDS